MSVIERAEKRLQEEIHQNDLGANNDYAIDYWRAYIDGARAQKREIIETWYENCLDGRVKEDEHE